MFGALPWDAGRRMFHNAADATWFHAECEANWSFAITGEA